MCEGSFSGVSGSFKEVSRKCQEFPNMNHSHPTTNIFPDEQVSKDKMEDPGVWIELMLGNNVYIIF